jgi:hypothetical protein
MCAEFNATGVESPTMARWRCALTSAFAASATAILAKAGIMMSDEHQLWPEPSTSAIVVHLPSAKHFTVGAAAGSRFYLARGTSRSGSGMGSI